MVQPNLPIELLAVDQIEARLRFVEKVREIVSGGDGEGSARRKLLHNVNYRGITDSRLKPDRTERAAPYQSGNRCTTQAAAHACSPADPGCRTAAKR